MDFFKNLLGGVAEKIGNAFGFLSARDRAIEAVETARRNDGHTFRNVVENASLEAKLPKKLKMTTGKVAFASMGADASARRVSAEPNVVRTVKRSQRQASAKVAGIDELVLDVASHATAVGVRLVLGFIMRDCCSY
jgi:hypothetical protein